MSAIDVQFHNSLLVKDDGEEIFKSGPYTLH